MATASAIKAPSKKLFLPVIHCLCPYGKNGIGHALSNAKIALENGADGLFLIGHNIRWRALVYIYLSVRKQNPKSWIGVNFLDLTTKSIQKENLALAIRQCVDLSAVWMDALPGENVETPPWLDVFGGVAFKYLQANPTDEELEKECSLAAQRVTFATTSGDQTGVPPSIKKLKKIHTLIKGEVKIAVASGVSKSNVTEMLPYVDAFLVASSICAVNASGVESLVAHEVATLAKIIHQK